MELRKRHGVTLWNKTQSFPGYTLFSPMLMTEAQLQGQKYSSVYLIDMNGRIVHYWDVPGILRFQAELLEDGTLLCAINDLDKGVDGYLPYKVDRMLLLNWESEVEWSYPAAGLDGHERCKLHNGNILILRYEKCEKQLQDRIKGGVPNSEVKIGAKKDGSDPFAMTRLDHSVEGEIYTIVLEEITPEKVIVWSMNIAETLDPEIDMISPFMSRAVWPVINSVTEMPNGDLLAASPNLDAVLLWSKAEKKLIWRFGQMLGNESKERISAPHQAIPLPKNRVLILDNGRFFGDDTRGGFPDLTVPPDHSRVIAVDIATKEVVWRYCPDNPVDFFSPHLGSIQHLPNDNTLICEGYSGRIFEINLRGEVVWQYLSPIYSESKSRFGVNNAINRAIRYEWDYAGLQNKPFDDKECAKLNQRFGPFAGFKQS